MRAIMESSCGHAACITISQLPEWLQPGIVRTHAEQLRSHFA
jgi:hypothetical protein